jgi:hypothetical protein
MVRLRLAGIVAVGWEVGLAMLQSALAAPRMQSSFFRAKQDWVNVHSDLVDHAGGEQ